MFSPLPGKICEPRQLNITHHTQPCSQGEVIDQIKDELISVSDGEEVHLVGLLLGHDNGISTLVTCI